MRGLTAGSSRRAKGERAATAWLPVSLSFGSAHATFQRGVKNGYVLHVGNDYRSRRCRRNLVGVKGREFAKLARRHLMPHLPAEEAIALLDEWNDEQLRELRLPKAATARPAG